MKIPSLSSLIHSRCAAALGLAVFLSLAGTSRAYDHDDEWYRHHRDDPHERHAYLAHPRTSFVLTYGVGYAGRGYYYGPAKSDYFYEGPGVVYYRTKEAAPREYWARDDYHAHESSSWAVQKALARHGYYGGPIDGEIGPMSRRAISRYQADHGLKITGSVSPGLLRSLKLV